MALWSLIGEGSLELYKNRKFIQKNWTKFLVYTGMGKTNILIDGRPTVGKTLFSEALCMK